MGLEHSTCPTDEHETFLISRVQAFGTGVFLKHFYLILFIATYCTLKMLAYLFNCLFFYPNAGLGHIFGDR